MLKSLNENDFINFLFDLNFNDYYVASDILKDISIIKLKKNLNFINVKYKFHSIRDENEQLGILFDVEDSDFGEYFPASVYEMTLTEQYVWAKSKDCDNLDRNNYKLHTIEMSAEDIPWGDPRMPKGLVNIVIEKLGARLIGSSLVNSHRATKESLPGFVPLAIRKELQECVINYINF